MWSCHNASSADKKNASWTSGETTVFTSKKDLIKGGWMGSMGIYLDSNDVVTEYLHLVATNYLCSQRSFFDFTVRYMLLGFENSEWGKAVCQNEFSNKKNCQSLCIWPDVIAKGFKELWLNIFDSSNYFTTAISSPDFPLWRSQHTFLCCGSQRIGTFAWGFQQISIVHIQHLHQFLRIFLGIEG